MRIYVASKFENIKPVRELQGLLEEVGHTVTCDWTKHKETQPIKDRAVSSWEGVRDCEVLILIPTKELMAGAFVEMGIALAQECEIIIVDADNDNYQKCIFYNLPFPWVNKVNDLDAAFDMVQELAKTQYQPAGYSHASALD